jgi:osmotically-inducible protein OsmY
LSGFVISNDQKQAAEDLAKSVPGVQAVENKISEKR